MDRLKCKHTDKCKKLFFPLQAHHPASLDRLAEVETARPDPRGSEAGEHHVAGPGPPALQGQGHRLWLGLSRQQGRLQHLLAEQVLQSAGNHPRPSFLRGHRHVVPRMRGG